MTKILGFFLSGRTKRKTTGGRATWRTGGNVFIAPVCSPTGRSRTWLCRVGEELRGKARMSMRSLVSAVREEASYARWRRSQSRCERVFFFWTSTERGTSVSSVYTLLAARFSHLLSFSSRLLSVVSGSQEQELLLLLLLSQHWKWSVGQESARAHKVIYRASRRVFGLNLSRNVKHSCWPLLNIHEDLIRILKRTWERGTDHILGIRVKSNWQINIKQILNFKHRKEDFFLENNHSN